MHNKKKAKALYERLYEKNDIHSLDVIVGYDGFCAAANGAEPPIYRFKRVSFRCDGGNPPARYGIIECWFANGGF